MIETNKRSIKVVADALDTDATWLANVLGRLGVEIDDRGLFASQDVRLALDKASRAASASAGLAALPDEFTAALLTITEMGPDEKSCRKWLWKQFQNHGLDYKGAGLRDGSRFTLKKEDEGGIKTLRVMTYVALRPREQTNQVGFTITGINDPDISWFAFIARPWGKVYLRHRKQIPKKLRRGKKDLTTASITFSPGVDEYLFENQIEKLKNDPDWRN